MIQGVGWGGGYDLCFQYEDLEDLFGGQMSYKLTKYQGFHGNFLCHLINLF